MENKIFWQAPSVISLQREMKNGHKGCVIWLTGLSSSGKSTLANALSLKLFALDCHAYVLDGDNLRHGLNSDLGFSTADRSENIRRTGEVAKILADAGFIAIVALISPIRSDRDKARAKFPNGRFFEVWCDCPLDACEARDKKDLYRKAKLGEIANFTGIHSAYEHPEHPEMVIDTETHAVEDAVIRVLGMLHSAEILGPKTGAA